MWNSAVTSTDNPKRAEQLAAVTLTAFTAACALTLISGTRFAPTGETKFVLAAAALLVPLSAFITRHDMRDRRIPNAFVLSALASGLIINAAFGGLAGLLSSLAGCALGLTLMLVPHVFGALGAGDVKLFAAVGSLFGAHAVPHLFLIVVVTAGAVALITSLSHGTLTRTMRGVIQLFAGLLPGRNVPRFEVPEDRGLTVPYGVAIMLGGAITLLFLPA